MKDDCWEEPGPQLAPDMNRGVRRLAQAVLVQATTDFQSQNSHLRRAAESFLYPADDRSADLRWIVQLSSLGSAWWNSRLLRLRSETAPLPEFLTCKTCGKPQPADFFNRSGKTFRVSQCKHCAHKQNVQWKAARALRRASPYAADTVAGISAASAPATARAMPVADCSVTNS